MKKKKGKKGAGGDGKRQVMNLREAPYSLKDGDVIAVVDRQEDPEGQADLTRADDEVSASVGRQCCSAFFSLQFLFRCASISLQFFFVHVIVFWHFFCCFFLSVFVSVSVVLDVFCFLLFFSRPCDGVGQFFSQMLWRSSTLDGGIDAAPSPAVVSGYAVSGAQENKQIMASMRPCNDVRGCDCFYPHLPHKIIAATNVNPRPLMNPRLVMGESMI